MGVVAAVLALPRVVEYLPGVTAQHQTVHTGQAHSQEVRLGLAGDPPLQSGLVITAGKSGVHVFYDVQQC